MPVKRQWIDNGDLGPMGEGSALARLWCRIRRYHLVAHHVAGYEHCVTCRARWT